MTQWSLRHLLFPFLALAFICGAPHDAKAQTFPSGAIRIIVQTSASTPPDIMARMIANALSDGEGWKVVADNKPGALTSLGAVEALKQPADGHTILSVTATVAAMPALLP